LCSLISPLGKCKIHFPVVVFIRFLVFRVRVERRTQDLGTALAGCNGVRWNGRVGGEVKQLVVRLMVDSFEALGSLGVRWAPECLIVGGDVTMD